jgi:N-acetylmuramoyl-L-alanine amidase
MRSLANPTVLLLLAGAVLASGGAEAVSSRPDRALYLDAKAARKRVEDSRQRSARPIEWERVVVKFRTIVARYPRSAYCDDALLAIGDIYRGMAARFHKSSYLDDAVASYNTLVSEYPSSSLGEGALLAAFEIQSTRRGRTAEIVKTSAKRYLENYPEGPNARRVRHAMQVGKAPATDLPTPPKPGLARVFDLRFWSGDSSTRVVIDLERRVNYQRGRLEHPDRLFFDLLGARIHPNLKSRTFPVGDGLLQQIRVGQFNDEVVRVVLDFKDIATDTAFFRDDPVGLVVDVRAKDSKPPTSSLGCACRRRRRPGSLPALPLR